MGSKCSVNGHLTALVSGPFTVRQDIMLGHVRLSCSPHTEDRDVVEEGRKEEINPSKPPSFSNWAILCNKPLYPLLSDHHKLSDLMIQTTLYSFIS